MTAAVPYDRRPSPADAQGPYGRQTSDAQGGYNIDPTTDSAMSSVNAGFRAYNPETDSLPRAESPPPLPGPVSATIGGQAIEMDATPVDATKSIGQYGQLRDSDVDVAGMVGLQQGRILTRHDTYMSEGSRYSTDEYVFPQPDRYD